MNLETIKDNWKPNQRDKESIIALWDSVATEYESKVYPLWQDNFALEIIEKMSMISKKAKVLDVGCGAGRYTLVLAEKAKEVIGTDISSEMIKYAKKKAKERDIENIQFHVEDWHTLDLYEKRWNGYFDLVFCHMSPAVQSLGTFEKLIEASKGWCILCKPTRRTDSISDKLREICNVKSKKTSFDEELLYAFETLWIKGYYPKIDYDNRVWDIERTIEESIQYYTNLIKSNNLVSKEQEKQIQLYLETISVDGIIKEQIITTVVMLYWHV